MAEHIWRWQNAAEHPAGRLADTDGWYVCLACGANDRTADADRAIPPQCPRESASFPTSVKEVLAMFAHGLYAKQRQIATVLGSSAWTDLPADLRADLLGALIGKLTEMRDTIRAAFDKGRVADLYRQLGTMLWLLGEDPDR